MLSEEEPEPALPPSLPPSAANHAMETTQCGDVFIFQPNATWEGATPRWTQHKPPPRSILLLSKKKVNYRD